MEPKILIVDDEAHIRLLLEQTLEDVDQSRLETVAEMGSKYHAAIKRAQRYGKRIEVLEEKLGIEVKNRKPSGREA